VGSTYFTAAYFSLMKTNKEKFKMKECEQVDLFFRSCFIFAIQIIFVTVIWVYALSGVTVEISANLNITFFFTVLILHFTCMPIARDGIAMLKYVLLHPDEFNHPISAFMLGVFTFTSMIAAELVCMANNQSKTKVSDAMVSAIGFSLIINLPTIYMNSIEDFPSKGAVGKLEQTRRRKSKDRPYIECNWLINLIYVLISVFYKCVFFYFFPFGSSLVPFYRSLYGNVYGNTPTVVK